MHSTLRAGLRVVGLAVMAIAIAHCGDNENNDNQGGGTSTPTAVLRTPTPVPSPRETSTGGEGTPTPQETAGAACPSAIQVGSMRMDEYPTWVVEAATGTSRPSIVLGTMMR